MYLDKQRSRILFNIWANSVCSLRQALWHKEGWIMLSHSLMLNDSKDCTQICSLCKKRLWKRIFVILNEAEFWLESTKGASIGLIDRANKKGPPRKGLLPSLHHHQCCWVRTGKTMFPITSPISISKYIYQEVPDLLSLTWKPVFFYINPACTLPFLLRA